MGILDIDVSNAPDLEPVADGTEAELRIMDVREDSDKNGNPYVMPRFEIVGEPNSPDFSRYFGLPTKEMQKEDPKRAANSARALKYFFEAFGIDPSAPGDPQEWVGLTGWAILGIEHDEQYGDRNRVKRFVTGA